MKLAETGDRVSSLAGKYGTLTPDRLLGLTATEDLRRQTASEIRSMAASLRRQDTTRGLRGVVEAIKRTLGR